MPFLGPPFSTPVVSVRNDLLSAERINHMVRNHMDARALALVGHNYDGTHNELEVARGVGAIIATAGVPSIQSGSSPLFTAVSGFSAGNSPVLGEATVTLNTALLSGDDYCIRATPIDAAGESVPLICNVERVSPSQVRVYCWALEALAGNSWNPSDFSFALAVHSTRHPTTGTQWTTPLAVQNDNGLIQNDVNRHTEGVASMNRYARIGHSGAGVHAVREVARAWARILWSGAAYSKDTGSPSVSVAVTRVSAGIATVAFSSGALATNMQVFHWEGHDRSAGNANDFIIAVFPMSRYAGGATPSIRAYIYKYNPALTSWARVDADFSFHAHSA